MPPARAGTQNAWSRGERTTVVSHEALLKKSLKYLYLQILNLASSVHSLFFFLTVSLSAARNHSIDPYPFTRDLKKNALCIVKYILQHQNIYNT